MEIVLMPHRKDQQEPEMLTMINAARSLFLQDAFQTRAREVLAHLARKEQRTGHFLPVSAEPARRRDGKTLLGPSEHRRRNVTAQEGTQEMFCFSIDELVRGGQRRNIFPEPMIEQRCAGLE